MTPDRWREISAIYEAAVVRTGADRAAYFAQACGSDDELRRSIESLIGQGESFLATPVALPNGSRLGPYELQSIIGAGGMGVVYRARDTRLKRDVALKVLPEAFALDPDRVGRFQREAELLATLNHPHIAAIYGIEESGETHALVMELVEGEDLSQRLARGPIALDEALPIARQIAEALEAAHEQGIIHRDLKPANIKVTPDGVVKVLDFGLAKLHEPNAPNVSNGSNALSMSPTITSPAMMTGMGVILGTAAYMAPEQAKGRPADKRSDIWAFGCVLYEMLTGRRAFEGDDVADTLAAVLRGEPDWTALPATTPIGVQRVLRRCLTRDPKRRLRDIGDAGILIEDLAIPPTADPSQFGGRSRRLTQLAGVLAGAVVVSLVALAFAYRPRPAIELDRVQFSVSPPEGVALVFSAGTRPALSPNGRRLAVSGLRQGAGIWVRELDSLDTRLLPGTENGVYPFWSPDSRAIGFFALGVLKIVDASGGPVRTLCVAPGLSHGGDWSPDGTILFASSGLQGLFSVPAAGGQPHAVVGARGSAQGSWRFPSFLPDGRHFLFVVVPDNAIRVGSLDSTDTAKVLDADSQALFVPDGYLLFVRQGTLLAQRFNARSTTLSGEPVPVAEQVFVDGNGYAAVSVGGSGTLAYVNGGPDGRTQLTWFNRSGRVLGKAGPPGRYRNPVLSPDETRVAIEMLGEADRNRDIWLLDLARDVPSRFTFDPQNDVFPVWSPDGSRIVFGSDRGGQSFNLYQKASNGSAAEELLFKSTVENAVPYSWSPDGKYILHRAMNDNAFNTGILTVGGDRKTRLFEPVRFNQSVLQVSRDGRWTAYQSNESGRYEVFVQTFPTPGGKWQVSRDGGYHPKWRADGKEIFYYAANGEVMAVPVTSTGDSFDVGAAVPLFQAPMLNGPISEIGFRAQYDVTPDGQRFLVNVPIEQSQTPSITVVLNWATALKP